MDQKSGPGHTKRKKLKIAIRIILASLVLGVLIFFRFADREVPGDVVTASGTIEATETDISPRINGRITTLLVDEGDQVQKGQLIAVLDHDELKAQVEQSNGALVTAEARLADLMAGTREEQIRQARANYQKAVANAEGAGDVLGTVSESYSKSSELKARLAAAEAAYKAAAREREAAQARLALVLNGPRKEDIQRLKANLDQARAYQKKAEEDYKRYAHLYDRGAISGQQFDNATATHEASIAAADAAEAQYREALAGSRSEEIREARARAAQADANLAGTRETLAATRQIYADRLESLQQVQSARTSYQATNAQVRAAKAELDLLAAGATNDAIKAARGQVKQAEGALAAAKTQLSHARIYAPEDGIVTVKFREAGEFVTPGTPIVRTADLNQVWLRVYAPLPTLGKIKVGQGADVRTDTYTGKIYGGRVASISEEPEFTPKNVQTTEERMKLVYSIRINVNNELRELKPGMPADADIRLNTVTAQR